MKRLLLAALIAAGPAMADESPFLQGDDLAEKVAKECQDGCWVVTREGLASLQKSLDELFYRRQKEAYESGKQSCRNAI